jgi:hypothetical protein
VDYVVFSDRNVAMWTKLFLEIGVWPRGLSCF